MDGYIFNYFWGSKRDEVAHDSTSSEIFKKAKENNLIYKFTWNLDLPPFFNASAVLHPHRHPPQLKMAPIDSTVILHRIFISVFQCVCVGGGILE